MGTQERKRIRELEARVSVLEAAGQEMRRLQEQYHPYPRTDEPEEKYYGPMVMAEARFDALLNVDSIDTSPERVEETGKRNPNPSEAPEPLTADAAIKENDNGAWRDEPKIMRGE